MEALQDIRRELSRQPMGLQFAYAAGALFAVEIIRKRSEQADETKDAEKETDVD